MYGGLSEEEAWKTVTLNPAKLLHLDNRMGSIKAGKDADLVLWSDNPLSVYAQVEKTYIDGALYFDSSQEEKKLEDMQKERARLVQLMLDVKKGGGNTQKPMKTEKKRWHCNDMVDVFTGEVFVNGENSH